LTNMFYLIIQLQRTRLQQLQLQQLQQLQAA